MADPLVIIGAGQAASQLVASLAQDGFAGEICLVGDEPHLPYQRPPLSKKFLAGAGARAPRGVAGKLRLGGGGAAPALSASAALQEVLGGRAGARPAVRQTGVFLRKS